MNAVDRPSFTEGQLLSAADLELAVDYARDTMERHATEAHTYGVVSGLQIELRDAAAGNGAKDAFVAPGIAVDQLGRQVVVTTTIPVLPSPLAGLGDGAYPVYAWVTEVPIVPPRASNPCATTVSDRIEERANVAVVPAAVSAASSALDGIALGTLTWSAAKGAFVDGDVTVGRHGGGVRAHEIVAPEHTVTVHGDDEAPTTMRVQGTLDAVSADDGTRPSIRITGGDIELRASESAPPAHVVKLGHTAPTTTSDALVIELGNADPDSQVRVIHQSGDVLASIDGHAGGTLTVNAGAFLNVDARSNVVVGDTSTGNTLTLAAVPTSGRVGVAASASLPLQFGAAAGDQAVFIAGGAQAATLDAKTLTLSSKQLALGALDASATGIGIATADALELRTAHGDVVLNPGDAGAFLRFTAQQRVINAAAASCDVTPVTSTSGGVSLLRLGPVAIAFGTETHGVAPLSDGPFTVNFARAFAAPPAFFATAYHDGMFTVTATITSVSATEARYKVLRFIPDAPQDGDGVIWSNASINVAVAWVALGTMT